MRLTAAYIIVALSIAFTSCQQQAGTVTGGETAINVAAIRLAQNTMKNLRYEVVPKNSISNSQLSAISIEKVVPVKWHTHRVSNDVIEKELLLKLTLLNHSDSVQRVYFYPGAYYHSFSLFRLPANGGEPVLVNPDATVPEYRKGFRLVELAPHDSSTYVARLEFVRTSATLFNPAVVQRGSLEFFLSAKKQFKNESSMITYIVSGIMLMMIFYSIAVYRQSKNREFLYYMGYAACLAIMLFLKSFLLYNFTNFNFFFESYWDFLVQCLGIASYFMFIRKFLNTKEKHPFLEKTFSWGQWIILGFLVVYTVLYFFTADFTWLNLFENLTKQSLLVIGVIFIVYGFRKWHDKLLRFLVIGNVYLLVFSVMSFILIVLPVKVVANDSSFTFLNSAILYYEAGLVVELMYFLAGLAYKNRKDIIERTKERERLRMDNERKEMEMQVAVLEAQQEERNRISADMHDELGSGVTAIRLMSEIVRTKMKGDTLPEIDKISNSANDLITKMNTIIWTMSSSNDTVENLVTYIRTYAIEFFESTNIDCEFNIPTSIPHIQLSGEKRRNIFLAVKESLNNILKHAKAKKVFINVKVDDKLNISIQDDGVGIDFEAIRRFGNGLKNMKSRLERIDGRFNIINNGGALTQFEMSL